MMINRHNYETFFLLYADNELSAQEKEAVENFVARNPDLKVELDQIMDLILPTEDLAFANKEVLFKHTESEQLQEKMLLMLDNELAPAEADDLNVLLKRDEDLATDWEILQRTKLDKNDTIEFKHKELLYRKERDNVVVMRWVRYAVAAALIGIGLFTGYSVMQNNSSETNATEVVIANNKKPAVTKQDTVTLNENTTNNNNEQVQAPGEDKELKTGMANKEKPAKLEIKTKMVKPLIQEIETQEQPQLATQQRKTIVNEAPENYNAAPELTASLVTKTRPEVEIIDKNITPLVSSNTARSANLDVSENEDGILYLAAEDLTRTKAGGFLRKVKRVVERNAKIKTGDEIKIAGFSFAVK